MGWGWGHVTHQHTLGTCCRRLGTVPAHDLQLPRPCTCTSPEPPPPPPRAHTRSTRCHMHIRSHIHARRPTYNGPSLHRLVLLLRLLSSPVWPLSPNNLSTALLPSPEYFLPPPLDPCALPACVPGTCDWPNGANIAPSCNAPRDSRDSRDARSAVRVRCLRLSTPPRGGPAFHLCIADRSRTLESRTASIMACGTQPQPHTRHAAHMRVTMSPVTTWTVEHALPGNWAVPVERRRRLIPPQGSVVVSHSWKDAVAVANNVCERPHTHSCQKNTDTNPRSLPCFLRPTPAPLLRLLLLLLLLLSLL